MGDDRASGPPGGNGRAPWERGREPRPGAGGRRSEVTETSVSVSDLVRKVEREQPGGRRRAQPDAEPETDQLEAVEPPTRALATPASAPPEPPTTPATEHPGVPEPAPSEPETQVIAAPVAVQARTTRLAVSRRRTRNRLRYAGRVVVAIVATIALVLTGLAWGVLRATDSAYTEVDALDPDSTDVVDALGQLGDETYLIVGTDSRAGANAGVGAGTVDDAEGARSDTVMLVNIPADRKRVVAVSFPRDLDVQRPACQGWDNDTGTYTEETFPAADGDKLNATYALGGPKCLVKVIQKLSGLRIGHFIGMDFAGFETMVNEVGGVEVCSTKPLTDGELGPILTKAGRQTVDGKTALNYVRARNINEEGNGDYGRIKRQQRFLSSLLRSALSTKVLRDPGKLNGFISAFTRETFVEKVSTKDLVTLGRSLQKVEAGAVTFLTVPTAGTTEYGNEIPRLDDITAIFKAIRDDKPLPGEKNTGAKPSTTPDAAPTTPAPAPSVAANPNSISLQVSNASGVTGLAATAANNLSAYGFRVYSVGNYTGGTSSATLIRYSGGQEAAAATVALSVPNAVMVQSFGLGSIIEVVLGSDFDGTIDAPRTAGASLPSTTPRATTQAAPQLPPDLAFTNAADDSCG